MPKAKVTLFGETCEDSNLIEMIYKYIEMANQKAEESTAPEPVTTPALLTKEIEEALKTGRLFKHFRGGLYVLTHIDVDHTGPSPKFGAVHYKDTQGREWVRPFDEFYGTVLVDNVFVPRFEKILQDTSAEAYAHEAMTPVQQEHLHVKTWDEGTANTVTFTLQNGPVNKYGKHGCQVDDMIEFAAHMLEAFDEKVPCEENKKAIHALAVAGALLDARTQKREASKVRNVFQE